MGSEIVAEHSVFVPIRFIRKLVIDYVNIDIICVLSVSRIQCLHGIFVLRAGLFAKAEIMCLV